MNKLHPVDHLAFWKTKQRLPVEMRQMAAIYDCLTDGDPGKAAQLDQLISWAREEAITDHEYSQGEC